MREAEEKKVLRLSRPGLNYSIDTVGLRSFDRRVKRAMDQGKSGDEEEKLSVERHPLVGLLIVFIFCKNIQKGHALMLTNHSVFYPMFL